MEGMIRNGSFFHDYLLRPSSFLFINAASVWLMTPVLCYHDSPQSLQMAIDGNDFYVLIPLIPSDE
jgi:hypothetical protein